MVNTEFQRNQLEEIRIDGHIVVMKEENSLI